MEKPPGQALQGPQARRLRVELVDLGCLVVGYGLAALLFRAFWPRGEVRPALAVFGVGFYLWLGLAMSGPLVLFRRRRRELAPVQRGDAGRPDPAGQTWAEMAWLLIGVYWIVLGVFVLPVRLHDFRFGDTVLFGLVPVLAGVFFRIFGPRVAPQDQTSVSWTHAAAVALLVTWPFAWFCLIALGEATL